MIVDRTKIDTLLAEKQMTHVMLSKETGISRQSISTILKRKTCEPKTAGKLAAGLGVPVSEILAKEGA